MEESKKIKERKSMSKAAKIALTVITVAAVIMVMSGVNRPHLSPFTDKVDFNNVMTAAHSDNGSVIIDSQGTRMLFLDGNSKLIKVVDLNKSGSPINYVTSVSISNDTVYATGFSTIKGGNYLSHEDVVSYSLNGKYIDRIYNKSYEENSYVVDKSFKAVAVINDSIYLTQTKGNTATATSINTDGNNRKIIVEKTMPEFIMKAHYISKYNAFAFVGRSGKCYWYDCASDSCIQSNIYDILKRLVDTDKLGSFSESDIEKFTTGNKEISLSIMFGTNSEIKYLAIIDTDNNSVELINTDERISAYLDNVKYGTAFQIYTVLYWLSVAWVIAVIIYALAYIAKNKLSEKGGRLTLIIVLILITSVFYTYNSTNQIKEKYRETLKADAKIISLSLSESTGDKLYCANEDMYKLLNDAEYIKQLDIAQEALCDMFKAYGNESSFYCTLYRVTDSGEVYTCIDSLNKYPAGIRVGITDEMNNTLEESSYDSVYVRKNQYASNMYSLEKITDSEGNLVGIVDIGYKTDNMSNVITSESLEMFINLLAIFILIYVCYFAFSTFKSDIKRFKSRNKADKNNRAVDLSGIYVFIYFIASSIDSAIVVYVAQSLCSDLSASKQALFISLPIAAASAGCWIGNFMYNSMTEKLGEKTLALVSSAIGVASLGLAVVAVGSSNIYIYVASKFLFGTAYWGIIALLADSIPYNATDTETRDAAFNSCQQAGVAATILAMLMGGYISELLSYMMIYVIDIAVAVVLLIMGLIIFTNKSKLKKEERKEEKGKSPWGLFKEKRMLIFLILYAAPTVFVLGYADYIFPLYSSSAGLSALMLSNIAVFASTISLLASDRVYELSDAFDRKLVMIVSTMIFCICFILFLVSPNIYWAVLVLFITKITGMATGTPIKKEVAYTAEEYGYDAKATQPVYYTIESGLYVAQSPVISAFLSFGYNLGTALLGIACGVVVTLYGIVCGVFNKK